MKPPPIPLVPSGLSPECPDVLGTPLLIQCLGGWGWTQHIDGKTTSFDDLSFLTSRVEVVPEAYIDFTSPRCGIAGRVVRSPEGYQFTRFLAFIMSDGLDYNFTENIAPAWRVFFGDGDIDLESEWFPILKGEGTLDGYGTVARDLDSLRRSGHLIKNLSEQAADGKTPDALKPLH